MIADLIYDVGMNNGDDTAYYLRRGFRVVAIEAAPAPVQRAEERFRREIAAGRLTLLNVAIAETDGTRPFWICDAHSDWSSFDRAIAAREGVAHHPIAVTCRRFRSVLEEFGVPYYLKIDIEGSDHLCVDALTPDDTPKYLSLERGDGARTRLSRLAELGYTGFKCISQRHFIPLQRTASWEQAQYENLIRLRASRHPAARAFRRLAGRRMIGWLLNRTRRQGGWTFPAGSSGPFGEDTPGRWLTYEECQHTLEYFLALRRAGRSTIFWDDRPYSFWVDFHARRED